MEIFKLFESTLASVQPGHSSLKDLRRDQILNRYDDVSKSLKTLIQSKESEIIFRKHLIDMLEKSKHNYDNKLAQTRQAYQSAKKYIVDSDSISWTPTKRTSDGTIDTSPSSSISATPPHNASIIPGVGPSSVSLQQQVGKDINVSMESLENRTSLDQRLSEFMKTFPNLTQASLAQPTAATLNHNNQTNNNNNHNNTLTPHNQPPKPLPGYYTQQPPQPPPGIAMVPNAPPIMDIMRFPPPPMQPGLTHPGLMAPIQFQHQPPPHHLQHHPHHHHPPHHPGLENNDATDMELSDYDETSPPPPALNPGGVLPMIASAMKQGAGGSKHVRAHHASPNTLYTHQQQQHYHQSPNTMHQHQYIPSSGVGRLAPTGPPGLAFDPAIMDSRDKQRPPTSSSVDKNKYHSPSSSSSSSSRSNKRR